MRRAKCEHGITVGANCGKCLDERKRDEGRRHAVTLLRLEAQRLLDWAAVNGPGSDLMGGRAIADADKLNAAATWLESVLGSAGKKTLAAEQENDRLRRGMRQIAECRNPNPCTTCTAIARSNLDLRSAKATDPR
jgi:hypothetical protein